MKPKTVLQKRIVFLSENYLDKFTEEQKKYGFKHCLDHKATRLKSGKISCLDCGHTWMSGSKIGWHDEVILNVCPSCNTKIKIEQTRKKRFYDWSYMGIITTCYEFQVIRLIKVSANYFAGKPADFNFWPVSEVWMSDKKKKFEIIGFNHRVSYGGAGGWWTGDWSLKSRNHLQSHTLAPYKIYPEKRVTPWIRRNGFKNSTHNVAPYNLFRTILDNSKAETLIKANQNSLLVDSIKDYHGLSKVRQYWKQIKMAMRNNYIIKDATIWYDYLEFCEYLNIDILKAEIVCPKDLRTKHNILMNRKQVIVDEENRLRDIENHKKALKLKKEQKAFFKKNLIRFNHLKFTDGKLSIEIFKSINQVKKEGEILFHCVYTSEYHLKLDSLLLSAKFNGKPVETIQVCLKTFELLQARGYDNDPSKYHKQILDLMRKNMIHIRKAMKPKKVKKVKAKIAA